jgi:hypothetical protein
MASFEYIVEKFAPKGAHPADFQKLLNDFAGSGHELVSVVPATDGVLWIIMRSQRQPEPMDHAITHDYS